MRNFNFTLLIIAAVLSGCASLSTYQTAQVLEQGVSQKGVAVSATKVESEGGLLDDVTMIVPEFFYRAPLSEKFEYGVKLSPTSLIADGKYQFVDSGSWDVAADLGMGFFAYATEGEEAIFIDFLPAILVSFTLTEDTVFTIAQKGIIRYIAAGGDQEISTLGGATLGLAIGKKIRLMPEFGFFRWKDKDSGFGYFGFGIAF